jgi:hypothetical protein
MQNKIGKFITGPEFGALASKALRQAIAEANAKGLPKAYSEKPPVSGLSNLTSELLPAKKE